MTNTYNHNGVLLQLLEGESKYFHSSKYFLYLKDDECEGYLSIGSKEYSNALKVFMTVCNNINNRLEYKKYFTMKK